MIPEATLLLKKDVQSARQGLSVLKRQLKDLVALVDSIEEKIGE